MWPDADPNAVDRASNAFDWRKCRPRRARDQGWPLLENTAPPIAATIADFQCTTSQIGRLRTTKNALGASQDLHYCGRYPSMRVSSSSSREARRSLSRLTCVSKPSSHFAVLVTKRVEACICRYQLAHGLFILREPCQ